MGFSGGIWLLWDDSVDLEAITVNDQIINAIIKKEGRVQWLLSAIYASPKQAFREELWHSRYWVLYSIPVAVGW